MALNPSTNANMAGRVTAADANYPYASAKDESSPGAGDGSPYFKARADDLFGFQQALLKMSGIVPSGNADTAVLSEYLQSLVELASGRAFNYDDSGIADAYVLDTQANQQGPQSYFDGMECIFIAANSNTGPSTIDVNGIGVVDIADTATAGTIVSSARVKIRYNDSTGDFDIVPEGAVFAQEIRTVSGTVAASALTLGLGATTLSFRDATIGSGTINTRETAAISLVVPSGATLGMINAQQSRLILLALDNAGTIELAVINNDGGSNLDESTLITTVAIDATADSNDVIYSTVARSNVPFRIMGYIESTQVTAGTWNTAPSAIQGSGGDALIVSDIRSGTPIPTTSGTSHDFTGIPNWVKRITMMFNAVSTNGTSVPFIQIGDSGGIEVTGYESMAVYTTTSANTTRGAEYTTGFGLYGTATAAINEITGAVTLHKMDSNTWVLSGNIYDKTGNVVGSVSGVMTLSDILDRIRLTTLNGTDAFDAGSINISYE